MARPPGAQNRLTKYTALVRECLEKMAHDPILEMVRDAQDDHTDKELRFAINKELAQYIAPKLKAVEVSLEADVSGEVRVVSFKDATAEDMDGVDK